MKQRNGFVSNSSSSSFIIGLGVVPAANVSALKQHIDKHKLTELRLYKVSDLVDGTVRSWDVDTEIEYDELGNGTLGKVSIESFNYDSVTLRSNVLSNLSSEDVIVAMYDTYGDDCDFYERDEDGEISDWDCNYDIGWDFFPESMQEAGDVFNSNLVMHGEVSYGAGRNG